MARRAEVRTALEDRTAAREAVGVGDEHHRAAAGRCPALRGPLGRRDLFAILGSQAGRAEHRRRKDVIIHEVGDGKEDGEVKPIEPPSWQGVVEFTDAVGFVIQDFVRGALHESESSRG